MPRRNKREQRMRPEEAKFWRDRQKKEEDEDIARHYPPARFTARTRKEPKRKV